MRCNMEPMECQPSVKTHFTAMHLVRSRGWTYALIRDLLPPAAQRTDFKSPVRYFLKETVRKAEQTDIFQNLHSRPRAKKYDGGKEKKTVQPKAKTHFTEARLLNKRGWTSELIEDLLPSAILRTDNKNEERYFPKRTVLEAERTDAFKRMYRIFEQRKAATDQFKKSIAPTLQAAYQAHTVEAQGRFSANLISCLSDMLHRSILKSLCESKYDTEARAGVQYITPQKVWENLYDFRIGTKEESFLYTKMIRWCIGDVANAERDIRGEALKLFSENYPKFVQRNAIAYAETLSLQASEQDIMEFLGAFVSGAVQLLDVTLNSILETEYLPYKIKREMLRVVKAEPKEDFPLARALHRKFYIHVGPTNSGKTYDSLQRLLEADSGAYLGPLRLLAMEVQEKLNLEGRICNLLTGEEEDMMPGARHVASTVERADLGELYDVVVIDECQMISDRERGYAWTQVILGVLSEEIHCCVSPEGLDILKRLVDDCGDTYTVVKHERFTPLYILTEAVQGIDRLEEGDALITFSKRKALRLMEELAHYGKPASVIYGRMPYPARKMQMEQFLNGETKYIVATDAIGMGMNLPIRRVLFTSLIKYDGGEHRALLPEEVRQIGGRAGRRGIYEDGYIGMFATGALQKNEDVMALERLYCAKSPQIACARLGYPHAIFTLEYDWLDALHVWSQMGSSLSHYDKTDIQRQISIVSGLRERKIPLTKEQEVFAAHIPFDEENGAILGYFWDCCEGVVQGTLPQCVADPAGKLDDWEEYCKRLDVHYSFSRVYHFPVDMDFYHQERERASREIHKILLGSNRRNRILAPVNRERT